MRSTCVRSLFLASRKRGESRNFYCGACSWLSPVPGDYSNGVDASTQSNSTADMTSLARTASRNAQHDASNQENQAASDIRHLASRAQQVEQRENAAYGAVISQVCVHPPDKHAEWERGTRGDRVCLFSLGMGGELGFVINELGRDVTTGWAGS